VIDWKDNSDVADAVHEGINIITEAVLAGGLSEERIKSILDSVEKKYAGRHVCGAPFPIVIGHAIAILHFRGLLKVSASPDLATGGTGA
jgi:hypothetical protein